MLKREKECTGDEVRSATITLVYGINPTFLYAPLVAHHIRTPTHHTTGAATSHMGHILLYVYGTR